MWAAIIASGIYTIIVFPFFVNVYAFTSDVKRLNFAVYLFNRIKIVGGYITFSKLKQYFHLSESKAHIFDLTKIKMKGSLKHLKVFELLELSYFYSNKNSIKGFGSLEVFTFITVVLFPVIKTKKDIMNLKAIICDGENKFAAKLKICFNLIVVIQFIIKQLGAK